jgi:hypothetical protein
MHRERPARSGARLARWRHASGSLLLFGLIAAGCGGPGRVEYTDGHCYIDGVAADREQIEAHQAVVTKRILDRQPYMALLTVVVVALAGIGIIERVQLLFSSRKAEERTAGARLRALLERYREHRVRYFTIVGATLALLLLAGGGYVYLDADKRASERALGTLQFCHLALRTADEQRVLAEQRQNLETIQTTATDIRALVDKLPPAEQRKAREIVDELGTVLGRQGKLVGEYMQRSDASSRMVREHNQAVVRGLLSLEARVTSLKSVPAALRDLSVDIQGVGGRLGRLEGQQLTAETRLASMEAALKSLAARAERTGATCACGPAAGPGRTTADGRARGPIAKPAAGAPRPPASGPAGPPAPPPAKSSASPSTPRLPRAGKAEGA